MDLYVQLCSHPLKKGDLLYAITFLIGPYFMHVSEISTVIQEHCIDLFL